jgi:hypothetical protein
VPFGSAAGGRAPVAEVAPPAAEVAPEPPDAPPVGAAVGDAAVAEPAEPVPDVPEVPDGVCGDDPEGAPALVVPAGLGWAHAVVRVAETASAATETEKRVGRRFMACSFVSVAPRGRARSTALALYHARPALYSMICVRATGCGS